MSDPFLPIRQIPRRTLIRLSLATLLIGLVVLITSSSSSLSSAAESPYAHVRSTMGWSRIPGERLDRLSGMADGEEGTGRRFWDLRRASSWGSGSGSGQKTMRIDQQDEGGGGVYVDLEEEVPLTTFDGGMFPRFRASFYGSRALASDEWSVRIPSQTGGGHTRMC
jgi:hypothetical protein